MKFITSLSVDRAPGASPPLWPHGVQRLVVVAVQPEPSRNAVVAYGVDPDHDHGHGRVVFEAVMSRAQLSAFIKDVMDGDQAACDRHRLIAALEHRSGEHGLRAAVDALASLLEEAAIAIAYRELGDPGLKVARALAASIRTDESLAEAVANPRPAQPHHKDC